MGQLLSWGGTTPADPRDELRQELEYANTQIKQFSELIHTAILEKTGETAKLRVEREFWLARVTELEAQLRGDPRTTNLLPLRPPLLMHPDLRDISAFFREQLIEESSEKTNTLSKRLKRTVQSREEFVLKLASDLSRDPYNVDAFVVRPEMQDVIDQILDFFNDRRIRKSARLLIGNKGCGKTTVGKIIVVLLACSGHVVLYKTQGLEAVVFPNEVSPEMKASLQPIFRDCMPNLDRDGERVFEFLQKNPDHQTIIAQLSNLVPFVYDIGDFRDADVGRMHGNNKWLIISSPQAGKLQKFLTHEMEFYEYVVLPTWTWDQIKTVKRDPSLSLSTVLDRFNRFGGGSLRHLLSMKNDPVRDQLTQLKSIEPETLKAIVVGRFETLPYSVEMTGGNRIDLDLVYRIEANPRKPVVENGKPNSNRGYRVVLASEFVIHSLVVEYLLRQRMETRILLDSLSRCSQVGVFAGCIYKAVFHRCISVSFAGADQQLFDIYRLNANTREGIAMGSEFQVGPIEILTSTAFRNLGADILYILVIPNFKTIDSFCIVPRNLVEKYFGEDPVLKHSSSQYFLIFFLATICPEHVIDGPLLLKLAGKISHAFKRNSARTSSSHATSEVLPFALVFLTVETGIQKRQMVTESNEPKLATVEDIRNELEKRNVLVEKSWKKRQLVEALEEVYDAPAFDGPRLLLRSSAEPGAESDLRQACPNQTAFGP